jgi:N-acetylmuramoyl-L-alanine amidase
VNESRIHRDDLPYANRLETRALGSVDLVVIHCTELPDLPTARRYGEKIRYSESRTGNSGHFYIEQSGMVEQWVPLERVAHHVRDYNHRSVGIELDNPGRYPDWLDSRKQQMATPYPIAQLNSLLGLLMKLAEEMPRLKWIAGHDALDRERVPASDNPELTVRRKLDPGPLFPWQELLSMVPFEPFEP